MCDDADLAITISGLVDGLVDAVRELRIGDPTDYATAIGPLVSQRDRVEGYIAAAVRRYG